jgi:hypothetical protein
LVLNLVASATDYYVSATGSDSANGLSSLTAWQSITKVNLEFAKLKPGDRVLFKRGDTFYGTLTISKSGLSGNPIIIGAYDTGEDPIITGFTTLSAWIDEGNGIFSTTLNGVDRLEIVTVDGKQYWMGQFPNTGYLTYETHNANLSITDNNLSSNPNWTGAEIFIRKNYYTTTRAIINDHTDHLLQYTEINAGINREPSNNFGYIIQQS